ncbi:MAG: sugar ABC transporter permease [Lachnospiraceae bacterium]|nr:sugar ABC transporter permease [Lachnospiraceae bacterium]
MAGKTPQAHAYQRPHKLKYGKWGIIFILPFFIAYSVFQLYPLIMTFSNSFFTKYKDVFETVEEFVGFGNYIKVFTEGRIVEYFGNTFILWLLGFIPQILVSLLFASWFTDIRLKLRGTGAVKVILYLPNMLMASSIAVLFSKLFSVTGPVNNILADLTGGAPFDFLNSEWGVRIIIAFINFLMWTGNTTILLMAGIMGIDPALYEASSIDGATASQQFRKITIPMLKPIMLYVLVTSMIGGLQMFDIPQLITNSAGGPGGIAKTVVMDISAGIGGSGDVGLAATESVILFFVAGIIGIFLFRMMQSDDDKEARAYKKAKKKAMKDAKKGVQ